MCLTQEAEKISAWGTVGIGISSFRFPHTDGGISGNLGFAVRYNPITVKYKRNVLSELNIWGESEQLKTHEVLLGYAFNILQQVENEHSFADSKLCVSAGFGGAEYISRDSLIFSSFLSSNYRMKSESGPAFPVELELELFLMKYVGVSFNVYSVISKFTPVFGGNVCIRIGYL